VNPVVQLNRFKDTILDLFFPPWCVGCGVRGNFLCPPCRSLLPRLLPPICVKCGRPLSLGNLCAICEDRPLEIEGIRSVFRFEGAARQAILSLKYKNVKALAAPLARLMKEYLCAHPLPADALTPVPLHPRRLRERGYNQSSLLAGELSKLTSLPLVEGSLLRLKNTPPQARTKSAEERRSNVAGAFTCRDGRLEGRRVLLIDDVCTSGATLDSCAAALKAAGAASVWGLTLAREV